MTIYVDDNATGANDDISWENAYVDLQDDLVDVNSAEIPFESRVDRGIYKPDQGKSQAPSDRWATFQLINGISLKAGYAGFSEPNPDARLNITTYYTFW